MVFNKHSAIMSLCRVQFHPEIINPTISLYLLLIFAHRCVSGQAWFDASAWIHDSSEIPKSGLSLPHALFLGQHLQEMIQFLHGLNLLLLHCSDYGQSPWQAGTHPWCQGQCKKITKPSLHVGIKEVWGFADKTIWVKIINFLILNF